MQLVPIEVADHIAFADVEDERKRIYLIAFATSGKKSAAASAAGIDQSVAYSPAWTKDEVFQEALKVAHKIAVDGLNDEARRRAVDGVKRYKFTRNGDPIRHPEMCVCGNHIRDHKRMNLRDSERFPDDTMDIFTCPGEDPTDMDARTFLGEPYIEHEYSDGLLTQLLKAHDPKFKDKLQVTALLSEIPFDQLPDDALRRIEAGEHPDIVLAGLRESGLLPTPDANGAPTPDEE